MKPRHQNPLNLAARSSRLLGLCSITFTLLTAGHATAQNTWTGASANWNLGTNWSTSVIPVDNEALVFNGSPATTITNNDIVDLTTGSITFSNAGPGAALPANQSSTAFTLGGNSIFLSGDITGNSSIQPVVGALITITDVINLNISLKVTPIIDVTNNGAGTTGVQHGLTINGLISETGGPFGITKNGSGTLTLGTASNNFTGPLTTTGGTILVGNLAVSGQPSSIGSGSVINLNGGTINFNGAIAPAVFNREINLTGSSTLQSSSTAVPFVINGVFNHTGAAKTFNLGGGSTQANDFKSNLVDSTTPGVLTFSKNDSGSWTLSGNNTYTGPTLITNGNLNVSNLSETGSSNIGLLLGDATNAGLRFGNLGATGNLVYTGSGATTSRTVQIGTNGPTPASSNNGGGGIKNNGLGALTFSANPFNAQTNAAAGVGANRTLTLNGTNTALNEITGAIRDNLVTLLATGTATVGVAKTEAGRWILAGANTYTGTTVVSGGTLQINNANALPTNSALTLSGGVIGLGAGDFTRALGTAPGQVNMTNNNSGFAAYGNDRTVNIGGALATLTWGTTHFMLNTAATPVVQTILVLGAITSTHTVDFQNPINLGTVSGSRFFNVANGAAPVDAIVSGAITITTGGATGISKGGQGTLKLSNTGNAYTSTTFLDSGTLMLGAAGVIPNTSNLVAKRANNGTSTDPVFDLNGFDETINGVTLGSNGTTEANASTVGQKPTVISSAGPATLTVSNNINYNAGNTTAPFLNGQATISVNLATGTTGNRNFIVGDGSAVEDLVISGELSGGAISKQGLGVLVLEKPIYSGNTTVSAGTLIVRKTGVQTNANPNNDASTVTVAAATIDPPTPTTLNLDYTGTDKVAGLIINSVTLPDGIYGNGASLPPVIANSQITGDGTITVASDPYAIWAGVGAPPFTGDANNDGVQNGLAWLLGAANPNVNANGLLPLVTETGGALTMTFNMLNDASNGGAVLELQHSSDLGISDPWTGVVVPNTTSVVPISGVSFVITPGTPPSNLNGVQATISSSEAAGGKVFGRLKGIQ